MANYIIMATTNTYNLLVRLSKVTQRRIKRVVYRKKNANVKTSLNNEVERAIIAYCDVEDKLMEMAIRNEQVFQDSHRKVAVRRKVKQQ